MNNADLDRLIERILGTMQDAGVACEQLGIEYDSIEDVEEQLLAANVERCQGCDWWFESGELVDDDGERIKNEQAQGHVRPSATS